jgi:hypothetical protein
MWEKYRFIFAYYPRTKDTYFATGGKDCTSAAIPHEIAEVERGGKKEQIQPSTNGVSKNRLKSFYG